MRIKQYRLVKKDGEIIQQWRTQISTTTTPKWWKPWESIVHYEYTDWYDEPIPHIFTFHIGDRVRVLQTAGFHKGAIGEVQFIEPSGKVWVLRDNSGSPVYYHPDELELIWRRPHDPLYATNNLRPAQSSYPSGLYSRDEEGRSGICKKD